MISPVATRQPKLPVWLRRWASARYDLALPQGVFGLLALGDVLACDQDDQPAVQPSHGFGVFTNPKRRTVLADLSDLPAMRLADIRQADVDAFPDQLPVFLKENLQHRCATQFADGIAELRGAKSVHRQHGAVRIDHEVHDRVMLEDLLPLRLTLAQGFRRTLFGPDAALERGLHLPAGIPHQMHHDQCGEKQGDEQRDGNQMVGDIGRGAEHEPDAGRRQRRQRHAAEQRLLGRGPGFQCLVTHGSTNIRPSGTACASGDLTIGGDNVALPTDCILAVGRRLWCAAISQRLPRPMVGRGKRHRAMCGARW